MPDQLEEISKPEVPVSSPEQLAERAEAKVEAVPEEMPVEEKPVSETAPSPSPVAVAPSAVQPTPVADPVLQNVERILSEDLLDFYRTMPPEAQARFKAKGEETAVRIRVLINKTMIKAKEVLRLIVDWLKIIPGVNKFFLEQESKIKTDKILELHKQKQGS